MHTASRGRPTGRAAGGGGGNKLLQLLRDNGFTQDIPTSTASWFNTNPILVWLGANLSSANVNDAEVQALYDKHLADAADLLGDLKLEDQIGGGTGAEASSWLSGRTVEDLNAAIQEKDTSIQALQAQVAVMQSVGGRLEQQLSGQRARHPTHLTLSAARGQQVHQCQRRTAAADAALNEQLQVLQATVQDLAALLATQAGQWLLGASDLTAYYEAVAACQMQAHRGMSVLRAADGPSAAPGAAGAGLLPSGQAGGGGGGKSPSKAAAALARADSERHRDQGSAAQRLRWELSRQRFAFKLALDERARAVQQLANAQGKLAAAEQLLTMGQSALSGKLGAQEVLHAEALSLEEAVGQLAGERLPELNDAAARLNDTRILAGDYDRQWLRLQLQKEAQQHFLEALLQGAAANKVMGELLALEEEQLQSLLQLLQLTLSVLAAAQQASAQRCASYASLAAACRQQRSAIAPEDSHLQCQLQLLQPALAAAAVDPQALYSDPAAVMAQQQAPALQPASLGGGTTPRGAAIGSQSIPGSALRTPGYAAAPTAKALADKLAGLATAQQSTRDALESALCQQLPARGAEARAVLEQLHGLLAPGGDAAAGSGAAMPVLTQPVLAEAMDRAEVTRQALMAALSSALRQQQHYAKLLDRRKREMELERRAMALFFCKPNALAAETDALRERLEGLQAAGQQAAPQQQGSADWLQHVLD